MYYLLKKKKIIYFYAAPFIKYTNSRKTIPIIKLITVFWSYLFIYRRSNECVPERKLRGDHRRNETRRLAGHRQALQKFLEQRFLTDPTQSVAKRLRLIRTSHLITIL